MFFEEYAMLYTHGLASNGKSHVGSSIGFLRKKMTGVRDQSPVQHP